MPEDAPRLMIILPGIAIVRLCKHLQLELKDQWRMRLFRQEKWIHFFFFLSSHRESSGALGGGGLGKGSIIRNKQDFGDCPGIWPRYYHLPYGVIYPDLADECRLCPELFLTQSIKEKCGAGREGKGTVRRMTRIKLILRGFRESDLDWCSSRKLSSNRPEKVCKFRSGSRSEDPF